MSLFGSMLGSGESLFRDTVALDYDYVPKLVPFREEQQRQIASCIKPLFDKRNGKNILITGVPGVGKTVACKHVLQELEDVSDDIVPIYINAWQNNSSFKIMVKMCEELDYKFTQNKRSDELFRIIKTMLNKKSAVIILDEIDKLEEFDFLYNLLEEIYRKTIILISNEKNWLHTVDQRIKSRLLPELIEFKSYGAEETKSILRQRLKFSFIDNVWEDEAFNFVAEQTTKIGDLRSGLYLLREAGNIAENQSKRTIGLAHAKEAVEKLSEFSAKSKETLQEDSQVILAIVKEHSGKKIGDLFKKYEEQGGKDSYKTFTRRIDKLQQGKFITTEKKTGAEGNTTIIYHKDVTKKLSDFA